MSSSLVSPDSETILTVHSGAGPRSGANLRVLITGAGAGLGYACARAFSEHGADLILSDIDGPALKRAATDLGAFGRFCDVASEASVAVFTAEVLQSYASLDVLINAAGRSYVRNLGTLRITRAFLPMMKSDGGKKHIVNIAPMGGAVRGRCEFPYAASLEAFDRLSDALAENVRGTKIALTTVVPSMAATAEVKVSSASLRFGGTLGTDRRNFEEVDPDRLAAAVVAAVHSNVTRLGKTNVLTAPLSPHDRAEPPAECADHPQVRKAGC